VPYVVIVGALGIRFGVPGLVLGPLFGTTIDDGGVCEPADAQQ